MLRLKNVYIHKRRIDLGGNNAILPLSDNKTRLISFSSNYFHFFQINCFKPT